MKRWLLACLLGLAILVFLSPGIIGMLAERSIEQQLEQNSRLGPDQAVRELNFERGWFTSSGRHRVPIADPDLARFIALLTPGAGRPRGAPALIIDTRFEHGLVPLVGAPRDSGALIPALGNGVSTLSLELADGSVLPVPGVLYSRIGLTGSAKFRYELPPGDETRDGARIVWMASDVTFGSNSNGRELSISASLPGMLIDDGLQHLEFSEARIAGDSKATSWGFAVGDADVRLANATWIVGGAQNRLDAFDLTVSSAVQGDMLQGALQLNLLGLETAAGRYDFEMAANAAEVDAEALGPIIRALQYNRGSNQINGAGPYPGFDGDLRRLLSSGITLEIDKLELRTEQGDGFADIALSMPKLDEISTWPGLVLALNASANIEIARSRVEAQSPLTDQLRVLIAGGFLVLDGDVYRLQADYANGKATINGAPLVIPLDMLR